MPSSRSCRSSYDCIVKIKGVTMRPILFSQLMRSDGEGAMNPEELFAAYCAVFATPFHAPLLQRSMADCHVAMRVALIARGAQAPLLANTAGYALSRCACALTRRLQDG